MITAKVLRAIAPRIKPAIADELAAALGDAMAHGEITTPLRQAHFLAQIAHESAGFTRFEESLAYSADRLRVVFPRYFTPAQAKRYAYKPSAIASRVYANRLGNGDEASGDGWRFRGRGAIHLTGRSNYRRYGRALGLALEAQPELAKGIANAALIAAEFWRANGCNAFADRDDVRAATKTVNGGLNGLADRESYLRRAKLQLMPKRVMPFAVVDGEARIERMTVAEGAGQPDPSTVSELRDDGSIVDGEGCARPPVVFEAETGAPQAGRSGEDESEDPLIGPASPERLVQALQEALNARNYDCGAENGDFGSLTGAAVLALKRNEGLDTSTATIRLSEVEAAQPWIVPGRQDKKVKDLVGVDDSITFTAKVKRWIWGVLGFFGIGGGATAVKDSEGDTGGTVLDTADQALTLWERVDGIATPVANLFLGALHWLWVPAIIALLVAWWLSNRAQQKRLEDYKNARML